VIDSVVSVLQSASTVYVATHAAPDGDAIGSALGLAWILRSAGKQCTVACSDPAPPSLRFLPGSEAIESRRPEAEDVLVVVDAGDLSRLGDLYVAEAFKGRPLIDIDHHLSNTRFGTLNIIDPQAAAVGEMIYNLAAALNVTLNPVIATCLLTAIVTDTIGFRTSSTTAQTLRVAAALVDAGAPLYEIVQQSFDNRPLPVLRIWGKVLSSFQISDGIAWASVSQDMLKAEGVKEEEIKGLVSLMRGTQGVLVSALLMETPEGDVKVEFRSDGKVNVADIATVLGGGGHRAASGCTLPGPLVEAERRALDEVRRHL
jgi:phosphoesterase RecJ-like protein